MNSYSVTHDKKFQFTMENEAIEFLSKYKKRVDVYLEGYFNKKLQEAKKIDPLATEAVQKISNFTLAGGKRIRPAMMYYGFLAVGGADEEKIVNASMSVELMHSFLLIHDDIIDKDETRHGTETLNESYRSIAENIFPNADAFHFGNSMAMIAGDMAGSMASEIIFNADFKPELIIRALDKLQKIVYITIPGEMIDVVLEAKGTATEEEIMRMYEGKTARYTFEGPLHLGAVLAGADNLCLKSFTKYSIPLGCAFQIRDDILGIFGDKKKLGKPVGSDIIEGKQTILVVKAMQNGNKNERKRLREILSAGEKVTNNDINEFRDIITNTGALEAANLLAEKMISDSLETLKEMDIKNDESGRFFQDIARYIIDRNY